MDVLASLTVVQTCRSTSSYLTGLPDALDEGIVAPASFAVHADGDPFFL